MHLFLPYVLYTVWCLSKSYANTNNCKKKKLVGIKERKKNRKTKRKPNSTDLGIIVSVRGFNAGMLARSQFESGRSCDHPTQSRFFRGFPSSQSKC
jgi:hypothetical protein